MLFEDLDAGCNADLTRESLMPIYTTHNIRIWTQAKSGCQAFADATSGAGDEMGGRHVLEEVGCFWLVLLELGGVRCSTVWLCRSNGLE